MVSLREAESILLNSSLLRHTGVDVRPNYFMEGFTESLLI